MTGHKILVWLDYSFSVTFKIQRNEPIITDKKHCWLFRETNKNTNTHFFINFNLPLYIRHTILYFIPLINYAASVKSQK